MNDTPTTTAPGCTLPCGDKSRCKRRAVGVGTMKDALTPVTTPALKRCPFCGGEPALLSASRREQGDAVVECSGCYANVDGVSDNVASANWNRRIANGQ